MTMLSLQLLGHQVTVFVIVVVCFLDSSFNSGSEVKHKHKKMKYGNAKMDGTTGEWGGKKDLYAGEGFITKVGFSLP